VHGVGVHVLPARARVLGDAVATAAGGQHRAVVLAVPPPVQTVGLERPVERLALQFGGVGDGADGAEEDG
jgi:hypothetical protein